MCEPNSIRLDKSYKYRNMAQNNDYIWDIIWNITPGDIRKETEHYIKGLTGLIDKIVASGSTTYRDTIREIERFNIMNEFDVQKILFLNNISTDDDIRNESLRATKAINMANIETFSRKDLYELYINVYSAEKNNIDEDDKRYMDTMIKMFKRNGLGLPEESRERVTELRSELATLCADFEHEVSSDQTSLEFTRDELTGLSEPYLQGIYRDGKYIVILSNYPEVYPILDFAEQEEVRRRTFLAYEGRCKANIPRLMSIIEKRDKVAKLLQYENWSSYTLELNMAKSPQTVKEFLDDLFEKLRPIRDYELGQIEHLKQSKVYPWDVRYYTGKLKELKSGGSQIDQMSYFPLDNVLKHMFSHFQDLFNLRFTRGLKGAWSHDVWEWLVFDKQTSKIIGKFYLDLYPRPNKYSHMACFPLKSTTYADPYAIVAMVCNFSPGVNGVPSLLSHEDVETLFHEFGHVMHIICGTTKYINFSGAQTEGDFVEAPSQMLENWCWDKNTLQSLSKHYETGESMSNNDIDLIIQSRHIGTGLTYCRQLLFAMIDQIIHTEQFDEETYHEHYEYIMGLSSEDTFALSTFIHIVDYGAKYYGYLWSKVYADDMYYTLIKNPKINSKKYKSEILEHGGARDATDMIYNFLGRKPSNNGFLHNLGII